MYEKNDFLNPEIFPKISSMSSILTLTTFFYFKLFIIALATLVKTHFEEKKRPYYLHKDVFGQFCMKKGLSSQLLTNFCHLPTPLLFSLAKLLMVGWPMLLQIMWCKKCDIWIKTELLGLILVKLWDKSRIWWKVAKKKSISNLHELCDYLITVETFCK